MSEHVFPRPASTPAPGPLDDKFWDLVEADFRSAMARHPIYATYLGIHDYDGQLGDASRDGVEQDIADAHRRLAAFEALDPTALSESVRIERELAIHNTRRELFDSEVHRVWERRSTAMDGVGDALFSIFARDFAPLAERLTSITDRLEGSPRLPRTAQDASHGSPGEALAGARDRRRRADAVPVRRDQGGRHRRPRRAGAGKAGQGGRDRLSRGGRICRNHQGRAWARRSSDGRSARPTTTSSLACGPSTAWTRARSSRSATSSWR